MSIDPSLITPFLAQLTRAQMTAAMVDKDTAAIRVGTDTASVVSIGTALIRSSH